MKIVISPAKTLDYSSNVPIGEYSYPAFIDKSEELIEELRHLQPSDVASLMSVSPSLAHLNYERFQQWHVPFTLSNARQALFAFDGDVYAGIDAKSLTTAQLLFLNDRVRILSGLYGILRPFDLMQPYRLEMGTKIDIKGRIGLYRFWGSAITDYLNQEFADERVPILLNLASAEYFKSVQTEKLNARIITPVFLDSKGGDLKVISFFAKKARGMMVRYICEHGITDAEDIKAFDMGGYSYSEPHSSENEWAFVR